MKKGTSTGIKDKNGRMICMGDKISFEDHYDIEHYELGKVNKRRGTVSFADGAFYVRRATNTDPFLLGSVLNNEDYINKDSYLILK